MEESDRVDYRFELNPRSRMDCRVPVFAFFCTFRHRFAASCLSKLLFAGIEKLPAAQLVANGYAASHSTDRFHQLSSSVPFHLLFPLFSSIVFVVAVMFSKNAIGRGSSPWTSTFLSNLWLAIAWSGYGLYQGELLPVNAWWQAALVASAFVTGLVFTYLAYQHGDISVATPIFGVKVIIVAVMIAMLGQESIPGRVWVGAFLATLGVAFVQAETRAPQHTSGNSSAGHIRKAILTVALALLSATLFSLFDVGLQLWAKTWGAAKFLPVMFIFTAVLSCGFLPWVDHPQRLRDLGTLRPMLIGTMLMSLQAMSMSYSMSAYGDATRINIVYALRGLWAVVVAWILARAFGGREAHHSVRVMLLRLFGAGLLTASVIVALLE